MAVKTPSKHRDGFDITVETVVGRVNYADVGDHPHKAAFSLIAEHGEGTFRFPTEDGGQAEVIVKYAAPTA